MIKKIKTYKVFIIIISVITALIISFLTLDAIYETDNWKWFSIDFKGKDKIISAYGSLIGGVLAFLSILFVVYQVLEQKEQIQLEKEAVEKEKIEEKKDLLKLISSFLGSIIGDIKGQGQELKKFYEKELKNPTLSNTTYFSVNNNFNRIIEMDYIAVYKSFRHFLNKEKDWEKEFLNFYKNLDFYFKITPHLRDNYTSQMGEKVKLKYEIQKNIQSSLEDLHTIRNKYITIYPIPPYNLMEFPYFRAITSFWLNYRNYIDYIKNSINNTTIDSDLTDLKITYFQPLFDELLSLQKEKVAYEFDEIVKLTEDVGRIIVKIGQLEVSAQNYGKDVKKNCDSYYMPDSKNLKSIIKFKELIDVALKKKL
jgi:large-conductance mechanosensitive channel